VKIWEALVQSQVSFGAEPGQVQQGSAEGSAKVPGSLGARFYKVLEKVKVWEALV